MKKLLLACYVAMSAFSVVNAMQMSNPINGDKPKIVVSRFRVSVKEGLEEQARINSKREMNAYIVEDLLHEGREVAMPKSPFAEKRFQFFQPEIIEHRLANGTLGQNKHGDLVFSSKALLELKKENEKL